MRVRVRVRFGLRVRFGNRVRLRVRLRVRELGTVNSDESERVTSRLAAAC